MAYYNDDDCDDAYYLDDDVDQWDLDDLDVSPVNSKHQKQMSAQSTLEPVCKPEHSATFVQGSAAEDEHWFQLVSRLWQPERPHTSGLHLLLHNCFSSVANPYTTVIYIAERFPYAANVAPLWLSIMNEFDTWIVRNASRYQSCLDTSVTRRACSLVVASDMKLYKAMRHAFQLIGEQANVTFCDTVINFVSAKKYKQAAQCVVMLTLQKYFDVKYILLPLIFQDQIQMVQTYIKDSASDQVALVSLLDELIDSNTDMDEVKRISGVPDINHERVKRKNLRKLASKLMKQHKVPAEYCRNILNSKLAGALSYLLMRRYLEKSVDPVAWEEVILYTIADNVSIQKQFIDDVLSFHDANEAARWAKHFGTPLYDLPPQVADVLSQQNIFTPIASSDDTEPDLTDVYFTLEIPFRQIYWVDSKETYNSCMDHLTTPHQTIAIDGEWRPTVVDTAVTRLALLQLATADRVYLLDVLALQSILTEVDWIAFAANIFSDGNITKLGYGNSGDMDMLKTAFPCMTRTLQDVKSMIDLLNLQQQISAACPDVFNNQKSSAAAAGHAHKASAAGGSGDGDNDKDKGLSELVRLCHGRSLDKFQQMSDWERRPLRRKQIIYAALDAHCLLGVYAKLKDIIQQRQLKISVYAPAKNPISLKNKKKKKQANKNKS